MESHSIPRSQPVWILHCKIMWCYTFLKMLQADCDMFGGVSWEKLLRHATRGSLSSWIHACWCIFVEQPMDWVAFIRDLNLLHT